MSDIAAHDPHDICACNQMRKATRAVTQHYDRALRPTGLRVTQFSVLRTIAANGPLALTALAEQLDMDRTTLTRNLRPLERDGLVGASPGNDSRVRMIRLTDAGHAAIERATPFWRDAQAHIIGALGTGEVSRLLSGLADIGEAARS